MKNEVIQSSVIIKLRVALLQVRHDELGDNETRATTDTTSNTTTFAFKEPAVLFKTGCAWITGQRLQKQFVPIHFLSNYVDIISFSSFRGSSCLPVFFVLEFRRKQLFSVQLGMEQQQGEKSNTTASAGEKEKAPLSGGGPISLEEGWAELEAGIDFLIQHVEKTDAKLPSDMRSRLYT